MSLDPLLEGTIRRRVDSVDVAEVEPGDPFDESGMIREILTTHRIPANLLKEEMSRGQQPTLGGYR